MIEVFHRRSSISFVIRCFGEAHGPLWSSSDIGDHWPCHPLPWKSVKKRDTFQSRSAKMTDSSSVASAKPRKAEGLKKCRNDQSWHDCRCCLTRSKLGLDLNTLTGVGWGSLSHLVHDLKSPRNCTSIFTHPRGDESNFVIKMVAFSTSSITSVEFMPSMTCQTCLLGLLYPDEIAQHLSAKSGL